MPIKVAGHVIEIAPMCHYYSSRAIAAYNFLNGSLCVLQFEGVFQCSWANYQSCSLMEVPIFEGLVCAYRELGYRADEFR